MQIRETETIKNTHLLFAIACGRKPKLIAAQTKFQYAGMFDVSKHPRSGRSL